MKQELSSYKIIAGGEALVEIKTSSKGIVDEEHGGTIQATPKKRKNPIEFMPWGKDNDLPNQLIEKSYANTTVAANLEHNAKMGYGDTLMVVRKVVTDGKLKHVPVLRSDPGASEIFTFLEDNNLPLLLQEQIHDQTLLHNGFVELILNNEGTKIVRIVHKEGLYSRLSVADEKTGEIEWHGYSANWTNDEKRDEDLEITALLDYDAPLYDLKRRLGLVAYSNGKKKAENHRRYVMHIAQPSPGRFYYQKAYWWSIFESSWYDFACAIPEFKLNLLKNQMVLKYHIQIAAGFFERLFKSEGITDDNKKAERQKAFYKDMEDFLSTSENAGKNFVSDIFYDPNSGKEHPDVVIKPIESFIKGGEYIEDSEEATNVISNAMGVHPSLQGASPGKNKTINGTEARELFIIKQAMMKPLRDLVLQPLQIVKIINKWDPDIDFVIPHIQLTTLDEGTGSKKSIGNQEA